MWRFMGSVVSGGGGGDNNKKDDSKQEESKEEVHRKRVCQILRYISTMQQSNNDNSYSFVRTFNSNGHQLKHQPFFKDEKSDDNDLDGSSGGCRVLFTTYDFQKLTSILLETSKNNNNIATTGAQPPFSFYTTTSSSSFSINNNRKRNPYGRFKNNNREEEGSSSSCWMRITRSTTTASSSSSSLEPPNANNNRHASVQLYLQNWRTTSQQQRKKQSVRNNRNRQRQNQSALSLDELKNAPPTSDKHVKQFLREYRTYLLEKKLQRKLEPIYNSLFEWYSTSSQQGQQQSNLDLIWGLGQATYIYSDDDNNKEETSSTIIDGPILLVRVEVELARDGALLVRPKNHVGVSLNRVVLNQLAALRNDTTNTNTTNAIIRNLNQTIEQLDTTEISPGQPSTYMSLLKRIAVELSSGGIYTSSKNYCGGNNKKMLEPGKLIVTDAWCVYSAPRPSAVWARDALAFVEQKNITSSANSSSSSSLSRALWALTHGPSALEEEEEEATNQKEESSSLISLLTGKKRNDGGSSSAGKKIPPTTPSRSKRPHFPLPTSNAQDQIAELLLTKQYPAVVCEGPPGTGKTHTIANIVCAYLCLGKRVLVTSKGAPALSVLRERLPVCVQELCVDVSMGESSGMRQLQQTVEKLANKVSWVNTERETSRSQGIQENIDSLEEELKNMDRNLVENAGQKRELIQSMQGQQLFQTALSLIETTPWLVKSIAVWDNDRLDEFHKQIKSLFVEENDPMNWVSGYTFPPSDALISLAAANAGNVFSYLKNVTQKAMVAMPLVGEQMLQHQESVKEQLSRINIRGSQPRSKSDWNLVFTTLEREKEIFNFRGDVLETLSTREGWPMDTFIESFDGGNKERIKPDIIQKVAEAVKIKTLCTELEIEKLTKQAMEMHDLETRRASLTSRTQQLAEDLVACRLVSQLSRNFSADAQSALVKFAQVSGKAKFGQKSSQPSKMTQRQRRKRQEYLDAFERCVKFIPCWILTSSQISDYLPPECLFDLVVIDEASQSDVSVLPGMLRGKQWLIVGDGKQVSPTESFVSEEQIELLKAAAPESPFEASMLPGHSFFDLCAQAFPKGRVILREHFRCAPEIIDYSNTEFYNGNLIPLRLPSSYERMSPSLVDIRVPNGRKTGKVNEPECDEIVRMIKEYVESCALVRKRTIGVISFVGDEQSRLIRGRLLDQIGPHKFKLHDILVGEPPSFQGAERDIVFLSLVSSPGHVVTQTQNMHAQRANVALSRARDRMVLVRSIDTNHIPNPQDIQFTILDFFERASSGANEVSSPNGGCLAPSFGALSPIQGDVHKLLQNLLRERQYVTRSMGVIWENGISVEDSVEGTARVAICVEAWGESDNEWSAIVQQQRNIERVGWRCLRVDAVSLLANHTHVLDNIQSYLSGAGVFPRPPPSQPGLDAGGGVSGEGAVGVGPEVAEEEEPSLDDDGAASNDDGQDEDDNDEDENEAAAAAQGDNHRVEVVSISDEEDSVADDVKPSSTRHTLQGGPFDDAESEVLGNGETAADYGNLANLDFLRGANNSFGTRRPVARLRQGRHSQDSSDSDEDLSEEQEDYSGHEVPPVASVARGPARHSSNKRSRRTNLEMEEKSNIEQHEEQPSSGSNVANVVGAHSLSRRSIKRQSRITNMELEEEPESELQEGENPSRSNVASVAVAPAVSGRSNKKRSRITDLETQEVSEQQKRRAPSHPKAARARTRTQQQPRGRRAASHVDSIRNREEELDASSSSSEDDLERKQRAISESKKQTFHDEDVSGSSSSSDEEIESLAHSRASKNSKRRRTRLDKYSRDGRYYHKKSEQQDDVSYEEYIEQVQPENVDGNAGAQNENDDLEQDKNNSDGDASYVDE